MRAIVSMMVLLVGCGTSVVPGTDGGGLDAAARDGATGSDAGPCGPFECTLDCEHGFTRDARGCEQCACNPPPVEACVDDTECVIARVATGCCSCERGYPRSRVDAEPCLVERGEAPPSGCLPDPEVCAAVDCAACEPLVRAFCDVDTCSQASDCLAGDVEFRQRCVPACASHADCTLAADYGSCCGGCSATPRAYFDLDPCFRERASDTSCAPAPGACDGLGCASPASDCTTFGGAAVCMADGSCREGGAGGACPAGSHDEASVCVPD
ncbi:MAG: hypothetical protein H6719_09775 [Sandaracinaceae bacterium]|nr:hypothetical protein [Sandaracinaceae bacterium]